MTTGVPGGAIVLTTIDPLQVPRKIIRATIEWIQRSIVEWRLSQLSGVEVPEFGLPRLGGGRLITDGVSA
jgi:hypothetical protein